jgi:signal transduction histidine kinase
VGIIRNKNLRLLLPLVAMAVLLPVLAVLQYHWLGQVSEGATERLRGSLQSSANAFRHDFNRELIRAYLNFHMDSTGATEDAEHFHIQRLKQWNQTSPHPLLISDVFVIRYENDGKPLLQRVNPQTSQLEAVEWSGEFAAWRERFMTRGAVDPIRQTFLESFADDIPALIIPLPALEQSTASLTGFTLIKLNSDYIQREYIPALVKRHGLDAGSDYDVVVTSIKDPSKVIYASSSPPADVRNSDVSTQIYGLEADELEDFLKSERPTPTTAQGGPSRLVKLRLLKRANLAASPAQESDGRWLLSIKHQSGSLATAVTSVRRRNLAISFGVLLLLGLGIVMTIISTRRAQRLAQQQINFVAGVSHELRTPLAVICSAGENLADGLVETPDKTKQYGEVIHREGRRLAEMVEQVLEFAGAQSGKQRFEFRNVNVGSIIEEAIAASQPQIKEANFKVETDVEDNLPQIRVDSLALRRVLQNLISNAIKYDGQNKWARVSAFQSAENDVTISVEDRGRGIESSDIPHIFEPFYRGGAAIAAQIKGSGVGLSIVKQIIEAHGGSIAVRSTSDAGTTFTFSLPVATNPSDGAS